MVCLDDGKDEMPEPGEWCLERPGAFTYRSEHLNWTGTSSG
jgi:hypothetical protein